MRRNYWRECIKEAFEDAKITATDEQLETVSSWVEGAHENYGTATGDEHIPNPIAAELEELKSKLKHEQRLVHCKECKGTGRIVTNFSTRSSDSQCWKCNGEGKHLP